MSTPLSETAKANLKLIVMAVASAGGAALTAITAAGQDSFAIFTQKPSVWIAMLVAVAPIVITGLSRTPQQARAIDAEKVVAMDAKVDARVDQKIVNLVDLGVIPGDSRRIVKEILK